MNIERLLRITIICCLITSVGVFGGIAVGSVASQEEIPTIPGVYYGEVSVSDGTVDGPVVIEAVADGEVVDNITADSDGSFGGPTISDDALEVQEPEDGEVEFHIDGEPVEIVSLEDDSIGDTTLPWDSGTQEVMLEADAEAMEPDLSVTIADAPGEIEAGSDATIEVTVDNAAQAGGPADVELLNESGNIVDTTTVTIGVEETVSTSLTWTSDETATGSETLSVQTGDNTDLTTIDIQQPESDDDDGDDDSGGGQGGGSGAGDGGGSSPATDDDDTPPTTEEVRSTLGLVTPSTQTDNEVTDTDPDTAGVQIHTEGTESVREISFDDENVTGSVEIVEYNDPPEALREELSESIIGAGTVDSGISIINIVEITPDNEVAQDSQATVEFSVPAESVDDPEQVTVIKEEYDFELQDHTWVELDTTAETADDDEVTVSAQTDGFSLFAVSELEPEQEDDDDDIEDGETDEETGEVTDDTPGFGVTITVVAVIGMTLLVRRMQTSRV